MCVVTTLSVIVLLRVNTENLLEDRNVIQLHRETLRFSSGCAISVNTRMHSSRMRTVRNSSRLLGGFSVLWKVASSSRRMPVPRGMSAPGGCPFPGGACSRGVCSQWGACSWAVPVLGGAWVCLLWGGGMLACTEAEPPFGQTDRCKKLRWKLESINMLISIIQRFPEFALLLSFVKSSIIDYYHSDVVGLLKGLQGQVHLFSLFSFNSIEVNRTFFQVYYK